MNSRERKEIRGYIGSGIVFLFVILLYTFIGRDPNELQELQRKNDSLETKVEGLVSEKDRLEHLIIKMQEDLIDRILLVNAINHDNQKNKQ